MKNGFFIIITILVLISGCTDDPCLKGSGDKIVENRDVPDDVNTIQLFDNLNLDIFIDTVNYLKVSGGENVVEFIETKISGKSLIIENKNKCNFLRNFDQDVSIELHITDIKSIEYSGSRNIIMHDTLNTDRFSFVSEEGAGSIKLLLNCTESAIIQSINGFSDINVYGKSRHTGYYNDGSGWIYASEFQNKSISVQTRSTGDCIVNADSSLACILNGIGNIQYVGEPNIIVKEKNGKGIIFQVK